MHGLEHIYTYIYIYIYIYMYIIYIEQTCLKTDSPHFEGQRGGVQELPRKVTRLTVEGRNPMSHKPNYLVKSLRLTWAAAFWDHFQMIEGRLFRSGPNRQPPM